MNYKIEKGIPLPVKGRKIIYPFEKLKIGDSFFIKKTKNKEWDCLRNKVYANITAYKALSKEKITITTSKQGNGIRVWRTK